VTEFPVSAREVDWKQLQDLYGRSHPLIRDADPAGLDKNLHFGLIELLDEVKAAHHLLDKAGVPHGYGMDTRAIDCRVLVTVMALENLRRQLADVRAENERLRTRLTAARGSWRQERNGNGRTVHDEPG
jgi:hypothetical protein